MPWETTGPPPDARVVDGVVVCRISLERPLAPLPSDGAGAATPHRDGSAPRGSTDPFSSIYRDFATLHTVTGEAPKPTVPNQSPSFMNFTFWIIPKLFCMSHTDGIEGGWAGRSSDATRVPAAQRVA
jgi:hypothetical protein